MTKDQKEQVTNIVSSLRLLFGSKGTSLPFNDPMMIRGPNGCMFLQCVSRSRGRKFTAEFVAYLDAHDLESVDVSDPDPWSSTPFVAPLTLTMLQEELEDLCK